MRPTGSTSSPSRCKVRTVKLREPSSALSSGCSRGPLRVFTSSPCSAMIARTSLGAVESGASLRQHLATAYVGNVVSLENRLP